MLFRSVPKSALTPDAIDKSPLIVVAAEKVFVPEPDKVKLPLYVTFFMVCAEAPL